MISWKSALIKHCESIEGIISKEKMKFESAKKQLKEYENRNLLFKTEREELGKIDIEIRLCKTQVQSLTVAYENIRKEILLIENQRVSQKVFDGKKKLLGVILEEIETLKNEIEKLNKKIQTMQETNVKVAKENKKKLLEYQVNQGFIIKKRSSECLQLGQMMMVQEEVKQALNVIIAKKVKQESIVRELQKNLKIAENECSLKEKEIRKNECLELERHLALIEKAYVKQKNLNENLELSLVKAQERLRLLILESERTKMDEFHLLQMEIKKDEEAVEECTKNIAHLNFIASKTYNDLRQMRKKNTEDIQSLKKDREEAIKILNIELSELKEENTKLDEKIEIILKSNKWVKKFEKNTSEEQKNEENNAIRLLSLLGTEEKDEKEKLQKLKVVLNKAKENIDHLLRILLVTQSQCYTEEKFLEDLANGLQRTGMVNTNKK